jgi:hypothetical protein
MKLMRNSTKIIFILLCSIFSKAEAKLWSTEFIKVQLPEGWTCTREEIDWVCQPDALKQRSEALMVVVVKSANEVDDTLEKYEKILKESREMFDLARKPYTSQVKYVTRKKIKDREWVDSLHVGSEIPGFYTRYLASINDKVAGLVTYSIAESVYPKYAELLNSMIDSLELKFDPKAYDAAMNASPAGLLPKGGSLMGNTGRSAPTVDDGGDETKPKTEEGFDLIQMGVLVAAIAAIGFIIIKRRSRA